MAEVSAVDVIQQVTQQFAPLVAAVSQVEAGLQREQAGPPGDQMVGVVVDPGLPSLKLPVGNKQPLLTQMEGTAPRVVCNPPQFPRPDQATPAQANQCAAAFVHLVQEGQDVQLALHRQRVKGEEVVHGFPPAAYWDEKFFLW